MESSQQQPQPQQQPQQQKKNKGVIGIANVGNTCYANSAIQLLRHCSEWSSFCLQGLAEKEITDLSGNSAKVLLGYLDLLKPLWSGSHPAHIQPGGFWQMMTEVLKGTIYEEFLHRIPHDAHEFLTWLLDQQFMATQKERTFVITSPDGTMAHEAVSAWVQSFKKAYSPLTDLCFGLMRVTTCCETCGHKSNSWETFNMLKVQPAREGENTIEAMLKRELEPERIDEYACDKCAPKRGPATRTPMIWRLPRNLFVVLKRFNPNGSKNQAAVTYGGEQQSFEYVFAPESPEVSKNYKYNLYGTVDHHGHHMGGHYTCQAKSPLNKDDGSGWWLYDDESVYKLEQGPKFGSSTYILGFQITSN
jgi:ubiquitin C-terminal hydrolase